MLATISTTEFDPTGYIELDVDPDVTTGEVRRRLNRIATLDGSAVINDFGFSEADRTIDLKWVPSSASTEAAIDRLVRVYQQLQVALGDAVWLAVPEVYTPGAQESTLRLLCTQKLSA